MMYAGGRNQCNVWMMDVCYVRDEESAGIRPICIGLIRELRIIVISSILFLLQVHEIQFQYFT